MQSLKELYKIGKGPSSSHTLAPERACKYFIEQFGPYPYYRAELFGSLSLTGKGHGTDQIIIDTLPGETEVVFSLEWEESFPNGFYLEALNENHEVEHHWTIFSLGGGTIEVKEFPLNLDRTVYYENSFGKISNLVTSDAKSLLDYIYQYEPDLKDHLKQILDAEIDCVRRGLEADGMLPGALRMRRSAKDLYEKAKYLNGDARDRLRIMAYAYAASEENGAGHTVVTAPTLGACGVIAAMAYYYSVDCRRSDEDLINALAIGGIFGNLIKTNATISGAVGGCQAEIGAAVSMASAACAYLEGLDVGQIEYAAEIGMEHNLGLTCDPVMGYVMIPCIERNSMGILRAIDAAMLSRYMSHIKGHVVSFDMVVETMNETGKLLPISLKETSEAGLAKEYLK